MLQFLPTILLGRGVSVPNAPSMLPMVSLLPTTTLNENSDIHAILQPPTTTPSKLVTLNSPAIAPDKLTDSNFQEWHSHWRPHLIGYQLAGFIINSPTLFDLYNSTWVCQD